MPTELTPTLPPTARPSAGWGERHLPSAGGAVNAVVAVLVALTAGGLLLSPGGDGVSGWLVVGGVVLLVAAVAQLVGELLLVLSAPEPVRVRAATVLGVTGAAVAVVLFAGGHSLSATCTDYCSADVPTGRWIEVIALGVLLHAVLTTVRLRGGGRPRALGTAAGLLAVVLFVGCVVFALVLGTH